MAPPCPKKENIISFTFGTIEPVMLSYDIVEAIVGFEDKWLMFGSFADVPCGATSVSDFKFADASPCTCERVAHGGISLKECHVWCVHILNRLDALGALPTVKVFHWKGRHVVFIGPLCDRESETAVVEAIRFLRIESKCQLMVVRGEQDVNDALNG